jgi:hypothetical protein
VKPAAWNNWPDWRFAPGPPVPVVQTADSPRAKAIYVIKDGKGQRHEIRNPVGFSGNKR